MADFIKKYWFISSLVLVLLGITSFYAYDTNKGKLQGKKVNGVDVVYSLDDINTNADELYDGLYEKTGIATIYSKIEQIIANKGVETTEEMKLIASSNAKQIIESYQKQFGQTYQTQLLDHLRQVGYTKVEDLELYLIQTQKINKIVADYLEKNSDSTTTAYINDLKPRVVSHILVAMADTSKPTQEELDKIKKIEEELASGKDFKEVAKEYSDDKNTAINNGSLGYVDSQTKFVPEFLQAMLELNENETSEWVTTQFGKHLIKVDASTLESLKSLPEFINGLNSYNPKIKNLAIWEKAKEFGIDFNGNSELENQLIEYLGIKEAE